MGRIGRRDKELGKDMKICIMAGTLEEAKDIAKKKYLKFYYMTGRKVSDNIYEITMHMRRRE